MAVLGTGLDMCYPAENRALSQRIVGAGGALVIANFRPAHRRAAHNFPRRNRIICGLARGTWWWRRPPTAAR